MDFYLSRDPKRLGNSALGGGGGEEEGEERASIHFQSESPVLKRQLCLRWGKGRRAPNRQAKNR